MSVKIGVIGCIVKGDEQGRYVKVVNDLDNTGGYLILTSSSPEFSGAFDAWVENINDVFRYFEESQWEILWLEDAEKG